MDGLGESGWTVGVSAPSSGDQVINLCLNALVDIKYCFCEFFGFFLSCILDLSRNIGTSGAGLGFSNQFGAVYSQICRCKDDPTGG